MARKLTYEELEKRVKELEREAVKRKRAEEALTDSEDPIIANKTITIIAGILILFGLYLTSLHGYLLFHGLAEIFSIVVACGIFIVAWNSRRFLDNNYLLFLGIAYLFVAGLDLVHTLGYTGMGVFTGYSTNLPAQLWIAARYMESVSLLIAPLFIGRKLKTNFVFTAYTLAISLSLGSIFYWQIFPICFVEGVGLTPFKKISEYIISLILLGSIALLFQKRKEFNAGVLRLLIASIIVTIASEMAFTFYIHAYGLSNLIGHYLKIMSFYLIYKAMIETGLKSPYDLLFRNLKQGEEALRESEEKYRYLVESTEDSIYLLDRNCMYLFMNKKHISRLGLEAEKAVGRTYAEFHSEDDLKELVGKAEKVFETGESLYYEYRSQREGRYFLRTLSPVEEPDGITIAVTVVSKDIMELKQAEEALKTSHRFLEIANRHVEMIPLLKEFVAEAKNLTGCAAVGIRMLDKEGYIPYEAYEGFSQRFYESESPLSIKSDQCMCINVIKGVVDPKLLFYTEGGSFYMNGTTRFLTTVSEEEKGQTRNVCNEFGYESVALVPISLGDSILGLIHMADPRENIVPLEMVQLLEKAAMQLGTAIQRVRAETEVRTSEEKYQSLVESTQDSIYLVDENCNYLFMNTKHLSRFGLSLDKVTGRTYAEFHSEGETKDFADKVNEVFKTGKPLSYEYRSQKDRAYFLRTLSPVQEPDGKTTSVTVVSKDIAERKQAEEELREAKELFEKTFTSQRDTIFILSAEVPPIIKDCNPGAEEMFGYTCQEMLGRTTSFLHVNEAALRKFQQDLYPAIAKRNFCHLPDFRMRRKDGTVFPTEHTVTPLEDDQGNRIGWVSVVREITERKRAQEKLMGSQEELRNLAAHLQSLREAERTNIAREIHDELGQALTALKMDISWLKGKLPKDQALLEKTKSMSNLMDMTIKTVKRISTELRPGLLDDLGLVAAIEWQAEEFENRTGIRCKLRVVPEDPIVDPDRSTAIFRILQETLTNVSRHAQATRVTVSLKEKDAAVELKVRDNGKGITEEQISDPQSFGLMGIRERVHSCSGVVKIRGVPGKGTTVTVSIPINRG